MKLTFRISPKKMAKRGKIEPLIRAASTPIAIIHHSLALSAIIRPSETSFKSLSHSSCYNKIKDKQMNGIERWGKDEWIHQVTDKQTFES